MMTGPGLTFRWRTGAEEERSFYNDAKFCNDNCLVLANCEVHSETPNQLVVDCGARYQRCGKFFFLKPVDRLSVYACVS